MQEDARGLPLTSESAEAVAAYDTAVAHYFEYRIDTGKHVKAALEADPGFVMARCLQGYLFLLFGSNAVLDKARASHEACAAGLGAASAREQAHVAALGAWLGGDMARCCAIWDAILVEQPHDLLALRLQHFASFWMGNNQALRGQVAQVMGAWDEALPGFGNVLGMLAFGLEECGDHGTAEALGRRAVEMNPDDLWAIHAVAHVLEMQGRLDDGAAWLDHPAEIWADRNPFRGHLWWHAALFPFERGDYDRVLALYDRSVRDTTSDFYLDLQNAASLLLRLEFQGVDVGPRWDELADKAEAHLDDHVLAFTDLHNMMSLARAGRFEAAARLIASLEAFGGTAHNTAAATMTPTTLPLCRALLAYGQGDYGGAIELLLPRRYDLAGVGGSHAQRDIFHLLLLECALRDGRFALARALLSERLALRPNSRGGWLKYATVLESLGEDPADARQRAAQVAAA